jgi:hypothetical protein
MGGGGSIAFFRRRLSESDKYNKNLSLKCLVTTLTLEANLNLGGIFGHLQMT